MVDSDNDTADKMIFSNIFANNSAKQILLENLVADKQWCVVTDTADQWWAVSMTPLTTGRQCQWHY
jgi:hypothetical protein